MLSNDEKPLEARVTSIVDLPVELQDQIASYLPALALGSLKATSKHFSELCRRRHNIHHPASSVLEFLEAEEWSCYDGLFFCSLCHKMRLAKSFSDNMRKKRNGRGKGYKRFCLDCGFSKSLYAPGNWIIVDNVGQLLCVQCRRLKPEYGLSRSDKRCLECTSRRVVQHVPTTDLSVADEESTWIYF